MKPGIENVMNQKGARLGARPANSLGRSVSESLCKREAIMSRICWTIIIWLFFSLAIICITSPAEASISQPQSEERININTASIEELQRLPGIGPALSSRIVDHRRRHGLFRRPQDIVIVRGMSAKLYRRIAHLIRA
jgi:competence ComEA-like helix-hairpin-helix protein